MVEILDLLGLQGTSSRQRILDVEDTEVNFFKDSVKPTNGQITLWEDLQVSITATM